MPSIIINSKNTTIKLTRAEVREMQSSYAICEAVNKHHPSVETRTVAANAATNIRGVLTAFGEPTPPGAAAE